MTTTGLATKNLIISSEIGFKRGDEKSLTRNNNMPHNNNLNLLQIIIIIIIIKKVKRNFRPVLYKLILQYYKTTVEAV